MRAQTYIAAALFTLWPAFACMVALRENSPTTPLFIVSTAVLIVFLLVGRWDFTGYYLRYALFFTFLAVTWWKWQWRIPVVVSAAALLGWTLLIRTPAGKAINLAFPLAGGSFYIAHGGSSRLTNHHHDANSQRYALDITKLDHAGCRAAGILPRQLTQYWILGEFVYSPCDGVVTAVVDGVPDATPGEMDGADSAGNHVVIRYGDDDVYVGLGHLLTGTVMVSRGDRIATGQPLARVGNSGRSSEPHLHVHAKRGGNPESMLDGEAVPTRFEGKWLVRNTVVRRASLQRVTPFPAHLESAARAH